jgi:hypothetical protein
MVKRLENRPFALLGINSDGDRDVLRRMLGEQGVTWRQALDGSTAGPIAKRWNVQAWPTIYVLDAQGRIRQKNTRNQLLEYAVLKLLDELEKPARK